MNWHEIYSRWLNLSHGLELLPDINKDYRNNENGILYFAQLLLLKKHLNIIDSNDRDLFDQVVDNLRTFKADNSDRYCGLFDRGQNDSFGHLDSTRTISHDNLTAIVSISYDLGLGWNKSVSDHALNNQFRFDNVIPWKPRWLRIQHPRDWFYWLWMGDRKLLAIWLFPIFLLANIISCMSTNEETSGKLLMFTRCFDKKSWPLKLTWWICNKILKRKYEVENWMIPVTEIYYPQSSENPIRILSNRIESL